VNITYTHTVKQVSVVKRQKVITLQHLVGRYSYIYAALNIQKHDNKTNFTVADSAP